VSAEPQRRRLPWRGLVSAVIALAAFVFIVRVVPFRDRCTPADGPHVMVPVERTSLGCTLWTPSGPRHVTTPECASLVCEPGLVSTFSRVRPLALVALFALYLVGNFAWATRWFILVRLGGLRMSLLHVWRVTLEAQTGGVLIPGGVGGDALRVGAAIGRGAPTGVVIASVLLDRVIGLVTLAGAAATISLLVTGLTPTTRTMTFALAAFPVAFAIGLGVVRAAGRSGRIRALLQAPPERARRIVALASPAIAYVLAPGAIRAIALAMLASAAVSVAQLCVVRGALAALGVTPITEGWVYVGSAMTFMVAAVPVLPGGWGTADAAFVFFLAKAGIAAETAFAASLLYRSLWYLSGIIGACLHLAKVTGRPAKAEPPPVVP
jgi:uncharacterized membrane protein YbhN (UPF0104 family)